MWLNRSFYASLLGASFVSLALMVWDLGPFQAEDLGPLLLFAVIGGVFVALPALLCIATVATMSRRSAKVLVGLFCWPLAITPSVICIVAAIAEGRGLFMVLPIYLAVATVLCPIAFTTPFLPGGTNRNRS